MRSGRVILSLALLLGSAGCAGQVHVPGESTPDTATNAPSAGRSGSTTPLTSDVGPGTEGAPTPPAPGGSEEVEDPSLVPTRGASGAVQTVTGVPTAGVEPDCWLLDGYLLVGGPAELIASGDPLAIVGRAEPDLLTTCQQGTPLRVESVTAA